MGEEKARVTATEVAFFVAMSTRSVDHLDTRLRDLMNEAECVRTQLPSALRHDRIMRRMLERALAGETWSSVNAAGEFWGAVEEEAAALDRADTGPVSP